MLQRLLARAPVEREPADDDMADHLADMLEGRLPAKPAGVMEQARDNIVVARGFHHGEVQRLQEEIEILESDAAREVAARRALLAEHVAVLKAIEAYDAALPTAETAPAEDGKAGEAASGEGSNG